MSDVYGFVEIDKPGENYRLCGECKACCTVYGVKALDKPSYVPCKYLCDIGCSIYKDKPGECTDFECMWRANQIGDEEDRPDKLGFTLRRENVASLGVAVLWAREIEPGRFDTEKAQKFLAAYSTACIIACVRHGQDRDVSIEVIGPVKDHEAAKAYFESRGWTDEIT